MALFSILLALMFTTIHVNGSSPGVYMYNSGGNSWYTDYEPYANDTDEKYSSAFEQASTMYDDYESQTLFIYKLLCGQSCQADFKMTPNRYCNPCYCDTACNYYGDCCPDYEDRDSSKLVHHNCDSLRVPRQGTLIPFVHKCPPTYTDKDVVDKCELVDEEDWRSVQPVTDPKTLVSYRNRYCAQCHAVGTDGVKWMVGTMCEDGPPRLPEDINKEEVYRKIIKTYGCSVIFIPPYNESYRGCEKREYYPRICNTTSQWEAYDPLLERACLNFPKTPAWYHTNIFCYMCNTYQSWEDIKNSFLGYDPNVFRETLSALLDLNDESEKPKKCDFTDPYNCTCRNVSCSEGKIYESGECESVYEVSNNHMYSFCINVTVVFNSSIVSTSDFDDILDSFRVFLNMMNAVVHLGEMVQTYVSPCNEIMAASFILPFTVFFQNPIRTEYFETQLLSIEQNGLNLTQKFIDTTFYILDQCERNKSVSPPALHCPDYMFLVYIFTEKKFNREEIELTRGMRIIYFSRIFSCPRVFLSEDEVTKTSDTSLIIRANNKSLKAGDFRFKYTGYYVCLEDYLSNQNSAKPSLYCEALSSAETPKLTVLGILSGVCTCFSVVFLLLTLFIFSSFKSLRTTNGFSIMALSLSLILAQILFEFGAEQTEIQWVCQTIGVLTHFFWLSSTFWMNVCTVILFYMLNFPMRSRQTSTKSVILGSLLYTLLGSAVIISITILTSYLHDGTIGYGGSSCYISTYNGRRYGFALPVGLLVLINIGLFSYTFVKLRTIQKLQSTNDNQISMLGCLKLSVITGLTWIFAFLYEATGNIILAYMFTLCVGLQGVAIFWAFVANKRVLSLIKYRLGVSQSSGSRGSSSKNDRGVNEMDKVLTSSSINHLVPGTANMQKEHYERENKC